MSVFSFLFHSGAADTTPDAFTFVDQSDVAPSSTITSAAVVIAGLTGQAPITITGGTYNINGGAYTSSAGTVVNGDSITARVTSSASSQGTADAVVTIGGVSDTFTATTRYITTANDYDSTNDYQTRGADLGGADSKKVTGCFALRMDGGDAALQRIFVGSGANAFAINRTAGNKIQILGLNTSSVTILNVSTVSSITAGAAWRKVIFSVDLGTAQVQLYLDDASDASVATNTNDTIDLTAGDWAIGGSTAGAAKLNGCLSYLRLWFGVSLDLSVQGNRRLFFDANGRPEKLTLATGTLGTPIVEAATGDASTNTGSGGNFTTVGALTACSTSPSD